MSSPAGQGVSRWTCDYYHLDVFYEPGLHDDGPEALHDDGPEALRRRAQVEMEAALSRIAGRFRGLGLLLVAERAHRSCSENAGGRPAEA